MTSSEETPQEEGKKKAGRWISLVVAAAFLFFCTRYIVSTFQWDVIFSTLRGASLWMLFGGSVVVLFAYYIVRALRWHLLLRSMGTVIPFAVLYQVSSALIGLSLVTPMQFAEMLKVELLKRAKQIGRDSGYISFVLERVADLLVVFLLMMLTAVMGYQPWLSMEVWRWLLWLSIPGAVLGVFVLWSLRERWIFATIWRRVAQAIGSWRDLVTLVLMTILGWLIVACGWWCCLYAVGISIHFAKVLAVMSLMSLLMVLSMVPGGVGVAEAGIAALLIQFGVSATDAQTGAIAVRLFGIMTIVLGGVHYIVWSVVGRKALEKVS